MNYQRLLISAAVFFAINTSYAPSILAQDSEDTDQDFEEVVVTGTRIARDPNITGALPIQSVNAEDIKLSGEFSLSDVINDIPALLNSTTSENSGTGTNLLDLRGLGAQRTLVLVDGRRHVGGAQGSSSVDIGSIPAELVERIEVLSGGASAIYGADAVTGVVNFVLKDDFEGLNLDGQFGTSSEGDGQQTSLSATYGKNFADSRGNVTVSVSYSKDDGLRASEREGGIFVGSARDWVNPALRFQQGEIGTNTPNFAQFFNFANTGLTNFGLPIPTEADFISDYTAQFGSAPTLTQDELDLITRAANAPARAILPGRTFPFTSGYGYIIPGNPFSFAGFDPETPIDLDGNGTPDCLDSFTGYNSSFGAASFGVLGGCWNVREDGTYAPINDGLIASGFQGFGGDSFNTIQTGLSDLLAPEDKFSLNLTGGYDFTNSLRGFGEFKYVSQSTETNTAPNSFWDLLFGAPDNPFLPEFIRPIANATGGVAITVDPLHFDSFTERERETVRTVVGIEGDLDNGMNYELSLNYGQYDRRSEFSNSVINDRFFASIDAVTNAATGNPDCRVNVDPAAPAQSTPFDIPVYDPGYFTFTAGSCVPLNIWAGRAGLTQEALDWVTVDTWDELSLKQAVFSGFIAGDTEDWFSLPAGPIKFATGFEYRDEQSSARLDDYSLGILPEGSNFAAGTNISEVSANNNLVFRPALINNNEKGRYNAKDVFLETSLPLAVDQPFARELSLDLAVRLSDYSTIGNATTWKANLLYAPVDTFGLRVNFSEAVRAPNITELFQPQSGTTFRPNDPCDAAQLQALAADPDTAELAAQTQANCVTDFATLGLDPFAGGGAYSFADPLSAAFPGVESGNPSLDEETAETFTVGFVYQPSFIEGFDLTLDYWDISIEDAIATVSAQDIVNGCYQGASLNANFCQFFTRNGTATSAQFGGLNFLRSTLVNFAKLETSGIDLVAKYGFEVGAHNFNVSVQGTKVNEIDRFSNPADLTEVDPELGEAFRPEYAGNVFLNWNYDKWTAGLQSQYLGKQLLSFAEIETADVLYGPSVTQGAFWQHDLNASYQYNEDVSFYGGINNLTDKSPFATEVAYPASIRGRFLFIGVSYYRGN